MTTPKTFLTLGQAAKATGKSKGTISNAIKYNRLRVAEKEGNSYKIDPADLFNIFEPINKNDQSSNVQNKHTTTNNEHQKIRELEQAFEHMRELRDMERQAFLKEERAHAETKAEKTKLLEMLDGQTRLLAHIKEETVTRSEPKMGFWGRLLKNK